MNISNNDIQQAGKFLRQLKRSPFLIVCINSDTNDYIGEITLLDSEGSGQLSYPVSAHNRLQTGYPCWRDIHRLVMDRLNARQYASVISDYPVNVVQALTHTSAINKLPCVVPAIQNVMTPIAILSHAHAETAAIYDPVHYLNLRIAMLSQNIELKRIDLCAGDVDYRRTAVRCEAILRLVRKLEF